MSSPSFSVVVPTYNRPEQLSRCLDALTQLNYPRESTQIIVVDDGSSTPLDAIVSPFQQIADVVLLRQENAGPAAARNAGGQRGTGKYIAFTDDDCMPDADWLIRFAQVLEAHPDAMVGGRSLNALPENPYSSASQALIDYLYEYYDDATEGTFFASNNIAMSRSHFLEIGGFDVSFPLAAAEDRNLCDCWQQAGYPMRYVPGATIQHAHALSLRSFWRQHFGYGRGAFCFHQIKAKRSQQSLKVEPFSFYSSLLSYPLRQARQQSETLATESGQSASTVVLQRSSLFLLSQVANVAGFFWEKLSSDRPYSTP